MYQTSEKPTVRIAEFSAQWEGRTIDGTFSLRQILGSGESSAVFLTTYVFPNTSDARPAAIKFLHVEPGKADAQLSEWRAAAKLSHPNLIRIFAMGRCELDALPLVYVVMEYADEDLSQVLPHRSLSSMEAREMLPPALGALEYLHKQGFVHAHLKPSNITAVDDCLKLSSDGVCRAGAKDEMAPSPYDPPERLSGVVSPAGDVWSLGMTLIEALTGRRPAGAAEVRLPADLPEPFSVIVSHALARDARERWTIPQISKYLADPEGAAAASAEPARRKRIVPVGVLILLALVVVVVAGVMIRQADTGAPAAAPPTTTATTPAAPPQPQQAQPDAPKPEKVAKRSKGEPDKAAAPSKHEAEPAKEEKASGPIEEAGPGQPLPEVTAQARSTIRGRVRLNVRVDVDPAGAVTDAKIEGSGGSRYFSNLALNTVRQWKFEPVKVNGSETGQRWRIRFEFLKSGTKVQRQRLSP
jgi:TonB family protein